jgi:small subunit ribosomal protein S2
MSLINHKKSQIIINNNYIFSGDLFVVTIKDLFKLKMHIGHNNYYLRLNLIPYIFGVRDNIDIFNISKILKSFDYLTKGLLEMIKQRGQFFLLGTSANLDLIEFFKYFFKRYNKLNNLESYIYVTGFLGKKWIGGIFSNWKGTRQFLKYIEKSPKRARKRYQKYLIALEGILYSEIKFLPDFIITFNSEFITLKEVYNIQIPMMGLNDSNIEPDFFLYKIISNDDNLPILKFFCNILNILILKGKQLDQKRFFLACFNKLKYKLYNDSI